jgi:hypothetical protein
MTLCSSGVNQGVRRTAEKPENAPVSASGNALAIAVLFEEAERVNEPQNASCS